MRRTFLGLALAGLTLAGCSEPDSSANAVKQEPVAESGASLDSAVLAQKPDKPLSVRDALKKADGETVVVTGRTPPENVKPFNSAVAAFLLMAPEDLEDTDIKEELSCPDAATCPGCRKLLDAHAVRVEVVDASGAVIAMPLEGFRGLKPGSSITVEGEVKRDGKDKKLVRIVAKRFYPG
jgi:hypothetical protein